MWVTEFISIYLEFVIIVNFNAKLRNSVALFTMLKMVGGEQKLHSNKYDILTLVPGNESTI